MNAFASESPCLLQVVIRMAKNPTIFGPSRITQLIPQEFSGVTEVRYITQTNSQRVSVV